MDSKIRKDNPTKSLKAILSNYIFIQSKLEFLYPNILMLTLKTTLFMITHILSKDYSITES